MTKFTQEQTDYIIANYTSKTAHEIADILGVTWRQIVSKAYYLKQTGKLEGRPKLQRYTDQDDEYILENYYEMKAGQIAKVLGFASAKAIQTRAKKLRDVNRIFRHMTAAVYDKPKDTIKIRDGYPDVPWWMRQSTRDQSFYMDVYHNYE